MVELIHGLQPATIAANLKQVRGSISDAAVKAGRDPATVQILAATKYIPSAELPTVAAAGITLVGENRAQDLQAKVTEHPSLFTWDFIGALQSRKVRSIVPHVRLIHSLASDSALRELERWHDLAAPDFGVLIEVNVSDDPSKAGVTPAELDSFIERSPVPVRGLMTMPPLSTDPEQSRRWFSALRELAHTRGLEQLSMGTTQDYLIAVEEGATIVRIGTRLYRP